MSGGSYDYAYLALDGDVAGLVEKRHDLGRIADDMAADGYPAAAAPVYAVLARLTALDAWAAGLADLAPVLKAFEWWKSGDRDESAFRGVLDAYLAAEPVPAPSQSATERRTEALRAVTGLGQSSAQVLLGQAVQVAQWLEDGTT